MKRSLDSPPETTRSSKMSSNNASSNSSDEGSTSNIRVIDTKELQSILAKTVSDVFDEKIQPLQTQVDSVAADVEKIKAENIELHNKIANLEKNKEECDRQVAILENNMKRKNLVFRGLASNIDIKEAVRNTIINTMKVNIAQLILCSCRKIYEKEGKMTIIVEFPDEETVNIILKHVKNLQGSRITIERDLSQQRQEKRKAMIGLKSMLREADSEKLVSIRNDEMRVDGKWFRWSDDKVLMHQKERNGMIILATIYNNKLDLSNVNYNMLLNIHTQRNAHN